MQPEKEALMDDHEHEYEAVYEDNVFKPVGAVSLPSVTRVVFSIQPEATGDLVQDDVDKKVISILSRRYNSGQSDVAARHNEHQL